MQFLGVLNIDEIFISAYEIREANFFLKKIYITSILKPYARNSIFIIVSSLRNRFSINHTRVYIRCTQIISDIIAGVTISVDDEKCFELSSSIRREMVFQCV